MSRSHTDSQGGASSNQRLSERRAKAVREHLIGQGVDGARMTAKGYGEEKPIDTNRTRSGRATTRRVDPTSRTRTTAAFADGEPLASRARTAERTCSVLGFGGVMPSAGEGSGRRPGQSMSSTRALFPASVLI